MPLEESIQQLARRVREASRLTILTGAGVSAASGVPTFRGAQGLWREFRPEDLATASAFARDPLLVWEWYAWRRDLVASALPNAAHHVIARWSMRDGCRVITQNVDDLHLRAGTHGLVRLHGSLWELSCWNRCATGTVAWRDERVPLPSLPPRCPACNGLARPAIVWFGEPLASRDVDAAVAGTRCDVFITVGTSAIVHPAAGLVDEARRRGAFTIEINPDRTPASDVVQLAIRGRSEDVLARADGMVTPPRAFPSVDKES